MCPPESSSSQFLFDHNKLLIQSTLSIGRGFFMAAKPGRLPSPSELEQTDKSGDRNCCVEECKQGLNNHNLANFCCFGSNI